jgi:hypothetical protein
MRSKIATDSACGRSAKCTSRYHDCAHPALCRASIFDKLPLRHSSAATLCNRLRACAQAATLKSAVERCRGLNDDIADLAALGYELYLSAHHGKQARITQALERWRSRSHACVLMTWHALARQRARMTYVMASVLRRMRHRELFAAFDLWYSGTKLEANPKH